MVIKLNMKKEIKEKEVEVSQETPEQVEIRELHALLAELARRGFDRVNQIEARLSQLQK